MQITRVGVECRRLPLQSSHHAGDGTDKIHEYEIGIDRLHIMDAASFADLTVFDFRGDAAITYSPGGTILLSGIDEAMVSSGMFLFG